MFIVQIEYFRNFRVFIDMLLVIPRFGLDPEEGRINREYQVQLKIITIGQNDLGIKQVGIGNLPALFL